MTQITIRCGLPRDSSHFARNSHQLLAIALSLIGGCNSDLGAVEGAIQPQTGTLIALPEGTVRGSAAQGTRSFIGIPYAAAPIGPLRWKHPIAPVPWSETLDATGPGVECIQPGEHGIEQTEDCLRLNVFAPEEIPKHLAPVLVWLHGGDNMRGSANDVQPAIDARLYDGASLRAFAKTETVVVTVNYRLGALGFLAHPGLTAESGSSGNYGLLDQQTALFWVQRNIRAFGGDPSRVTLFGQGSGATDACYQLAARDAHDLVHAAVLESGSCNGTALPDLTAGHARGVAFAREVGCDRKEPYKAMACLRTRPAADLVDYSPATAPSTYRESNVASASEAADLGLPASDTLAIVDGQWLREQPRAAFAQGQFERVPIIVGSNAREGSYFVRERSSAWSADAYRLWLSSAFGPIQAGPIAAQYSVARARPQDVATQVITDAFFVCPAEHFADVASVNTDVYRYTFERAPYIEPLEGLGATHGAELLWVWDVWPGVSPYAGDDVGLAQTIAGYWSRLVDGDPNGEYAPEWPRYDREKRTELVLDLNIVPREVGDAGRCQFWRELWSGKQVVNPQRGEPAEDPVRGPAAADIRPRKPL